MNLNLKKRLGLGTRLPLTVGEDTLSKGAGYAATLKAFRAFLAGNVDDENPHSLPANPNPPTLRLSVGSSSAPSSPDAELTTLYSYNVNDEKFLYLNGGRKTHNTVFRRFPVATIAAGGGNVSNGEDARDWRVGMRFTGQKIAFRVDGNGNLFPSTGTAGWRWIVDGQYLDVAEPSAVSPGRRWLVLDFGSSGTHDIYMEGQAAASFYQIAVAPGDTVAALPAPVFRGIALGDSFTEGAGAPAIGDAAMRVLSDYAGIELWQSGVGGTGYIATQGGAKYNLGQRVVADLTRVSALGPVDIVYVAVGINDIGQSGVKDAADSVFTTIRSMCPTALVFVVGPWDVNAPAGPVTNYAACKSAIQEAMSGRGGFYFLDMEGVSFTKADATHPDQPGHLLLGQSLNTKTRAAVAI